MPRYRKRWMDGKQMYNIVIPNIMLLIIMYSICLSVVTSVSH